MQIGDLDVTGHEQERDRDHRETEGRDERQQGDPLAALGRVDVASWRARITDARRIVGSARRRRGAAGGGMVAGDAAAPG